MVQPTPEELAKMTLEELEALSPLEMSVGMQRAVTYYCAQRWRETYASAGLFATPVQPEAQSIRDEQTPPTALPRTAIEVNIDGEIVCTAGFRQIGHNG